MPDQTSEPRVSYTKSVINKNRLLSFLLPFLFIILTLVLIIVWRAFLPSKNNLNPLIIPTKNTYPSKETSSSTQKNPKPAESTTSAETSVSAEKNLPTLTGNPAEYLKSDKKTDTLFSELDGQIALMEKQELSVALTKRMRIRAQAAFERGDETEARRILLWTLQLTKEMLELGV